MSPSTSERRRRTRRRHEGEAAETLQRCLSELNVLGYISEDAFRVMQSKVAKVVVKHGQVADTA